MGDTRDPSTGPSESHFQHSSKTKSTSKGGASKKSKANQMSHGKSQHIPHSKRNQHPKPEWREKRPSFQRADSSSSSQKNGSVESESSNLKPQLKGGKKKASLSLNHLLNFSLPPRDSERSDVPGCHRSKRSNYHHYNKEQFVQANCQFVVRLSGDYSVHLSDPDTLVAWDSIEQVRLFCYEIPCCPICLDSPRTAKITKCGHVFCWSCILHYLTLSEYKWQKCPICFDSIYRADLKSVVAVSSKMYNVGDTITMSLMMRPRDGMSAFPKFQYIEDHSDDLLSVDDPMATNFVKLLSATPELVFRTILLGEKKTLQSQLSSLTKDEESERCFIEAALADLEERETEVMRCRNLVGEFDRFVEDLEMKGTGDNLSTCVFTPVGESSSKRKAILERSLDAPFTESESNSGNSLNNHSDEQSGSDREKVSQSIGLSSGLGTDNPQNQDLCFVSEPSVETSGEVLTASEQSTREGVSAISTTPPSSANDVKPPPSGGMPPADVGRHSSSSEGDVPSSSAHSDGPAVNSAEQLAVPVGGGSLCLPEVPLTTRLEGLETPMTAIAPSILGTESSHNDTDDVSQSQLQSSTGAEFVYFFQSADGQQLYLHPVNARCLMREYKSLEFAPQTITAKIVDMEQMGITEVTRSKYRYLRHLPLTCQFALCELDLNPPLLSRATLREHEADLNRRRQKRQKKEKEKQPSRVLTGILDFGSKGSADISPEDFHDLLSVASSPLPSANPGTQPATSSQGHQRNSKARDIPSGICSHQPQENDITGDADKCSLQDSSLTISHSLPSFASALKGPNKPLSTPTWPGQTSKEAQPRGVRPAHSSGTAVAVNSEGEEEESSSVPSLRDAFVLAFSIENRDTSIDTPGKPGGSKTAKKKRKNKILFSNGGMRGRV